jgi:hypothetical protein
MLDPNVATVRDLYEHLTAHGADTPAFLPKDVWELKPGELGIMFCTRNFKVKGGRTVKVEIRRFDYSTVHIILRSLEDQDMRRLVLQIAGREDDGTIILRFNEVYSPRMEISQADLVKICKSLYKALRK